MSKSELLEIHFEGWTATPRMPFILSGNALCMHTPSYSTLLGLIGCCVGRLVTPDEVQIGFFYQYESRHQDVESRQRLEFDGSKIKSHSKGPDAYPREFHIYPELTVWIDRTDWEAHFKEPVGTPSLGRSQDLLHIKEVKKTKVESVKEGRISGCMIPFFPTVNASGQLVQMAEAYKENDEIGTGRIPTQSKIFMAIPHDNPSKISINNLYRTDEGKELYLHNWE
jgi:CRISPR-associated protein Cas5t